MSTVTLSALAHTRCAVEAKPGDVVVFDNAHLTGGVSMPSGVGATEEEARKDARRTAENAGILGNSLSGPAYLVIEG